MENGQLSMVGVAPVAAKAPKGKAPKAPRIPIVVADAPIVAADRGRAAADQETAEAAGFALKAPIYTLGTPVNQIGVRNYRASRQSFERLPRLADVCRDAAATIKAEERSDVKVKLADVALSRDGRLVAGASRLQVTPHAFRQLLARKDAPIGATTYLASCPPELRALNFNHWQGERPGSEVLLRTRMQNGERQAFSAMGSRYKAFDVDQLAGVLAAAQSVAGAKGEFLYDGQRAQLKAIYHSDIKAEGAVAGELFKACVVIDTSDDGSQGIRVRAAVVRNLCRNLIILDQSEQVEYTAHTRDDMRTVCTDMVKRAFGKIDAFAKQWTEATRDKVLDQVPDTYDVRHIFKQLWDQALIGVTGIDEDQQLDRFVSAWKKEPGYTRADVINAVTRAAHEESWSNPWDSTDLEEQAGQLLYNRLQLVA
jgi:hypothetical protein